MVNGKRKRRAGDVRHQLYCTKITLTGYSSFFIYKPAGRPGNSSLASVHLAVRCAQFILFFQLVHSTKLLNHARAYGQKDTCVRTLVPTCCPSHEHTHVNTHAHARTYMRTQARTYKHTFLHTHVCVWMLHTYPYTCAHYILM